MGYCITMSKLPKLEQIEADLLFSAIMVKDLQAPSSLKPHPSEVTIS